MQDVIQAIKDGKHNKESLNFEKGTIEYTIGATVYVAPYVDNKADLTKLKAKHSDKRNSPYIRSAGDNSTQW